MSGAQQSAIPPGLSFFFCVCVCLYLRVCPCVLKVSECCDLWKHNPGDSGHKFPSITGRRRRSFCSPAGRRSGTRQAASLSFTFTPIGQHPSHLLPSITTRFSLFFLHLSIGHSAACSHKHESNSSRVQRLTGI